MAEVNSFIVDAGTSRVSAFCANSVSPRVRLMTMAPHSPLRVRLSSSVPRSLVSAVASRGVVNRSAGITGVRAARVVRALLLRDPVRVVFGRVDCAFARVVTVAAAAVHTNAAGTGALPVISGSECRQDGATIQRAGSDARRGR